MSETTITLPAQSYFYTGEAICPIPVVTYQGVTFVENQDYTVTYSNNVKVGTATVTIKGVGNCKGSVQMTFTILCPHNHYSDGVCTNCGYVCVHSYNKNTYKCTMCGMDCPHNYGVSIKVDATCSGQGMTVYQCEDCGHEYAEILDTLGHKYTYTYTDTSHQGV